MFRPRRIIEILSRYIKDIFWRLNNQCWLLPIRNGLSLTILPTIVLPAGLFKSIDWKEKNLINSKVQDKIIVCAKKFLGHLFDLLGENNIFAGEKINWHCDFKTGYCWNPRTYYRSIKIPYNQADIKVPWELSRFQHLIGLGQAYQFTKDEKYAREFVAQVSDWINSNQPKFGVNWACTMDVAIRASNWIIGWEFFKDSKEISSEFILKFLKSLYQHGCHIKDNLEYSETLTSNHYLSDIAGLIFIGTVFPEFKDSQKWQKFAVIELINEMKKQVYDDGTDFEASPCYHRLVLELFFFCALLLVTNNKDFSGENYRKTAEKILGKEFTEKLYKMFDSICFLLKPDGRMSQIGDNDSGQFFKLYPREVLDMRYLLAWGAVFFKEPRWKVAEFFQTEEDLAEVFLLFGQNGSKVWNSLEWNYLKNIKSKSFPDSGWYVMRDDKNYCLISCGPNGQKGNGGHCHNDKLSFELSLGGRDLIVDPGTYVYTLDLKYRDMARSTDFHNTLSVDGLEQNQFDKKRWSVLKEKSQARCTRWENGPDKLFFAGEHRGFTSGRNNLVHRREIIWLLRENRIIIKDSIDSLKGNDDQTHSLFINFNIAEGREINIDKNTNKIFINPGNVSLEYSRDLETQIGKGYFFNGYGNKKEIDRVILEGKFKVPCQIRNEISYEH